MTVTVALFGPFRDALEDKHVELDIETPTTVSAVIDELIRSVPALENDLTSITDNAGVVITVNGKHIQQLDEAETVVETGAVVRITPPITGGRS